MRNSFLHRNKFIKNQIHFYFLLRFSQFDWIVLNCCLFYFFPAYRYIYVHNIHVSKSHVISTHLLIACLLNYLHSIWNHVHSFLLQFLLLLFVVAGRALMCFRVWKVIYIGLNRKKKLLFGSRFFFSYGVVLRVFPNVFRVIYVSMRECMGFILSAAAVDSTSKSFPLYFFLSLFLRACSNFIPRCFIRLTTRREEATTEKNNMYNSIKIDSRSHTDLYSVLFTIGVMPKMQST